MRRRVRCGRCLRWLLVPLASIEHFHVCRAVSFRRRVRVLLGDDTVTIEEARRNVWADFAGGASGFAAKLDEEDGRS